MMNMGAPSAPAVPEAGAPAIVRGVCRLLGALDYGVLTEVPLANGRRADVMGLHRTGNIAIVEVKASRANFRSDGKWPEYGPFCDSFYFAVGPEFPREVLPDGPGIIVADAWQAAVVREAPAVPLAAARRKALMLRFARAAAARLERIRDPHGAATPTA